MSEFVGSATAAAGMFPVPVVGVAVSTYVAFTALVLAAIVFVYFLVQRGRNRELPQKKQRREALEPDKDYTPGAAPHEDREEVEEPVEISDEMSLAEVKRAKAARVKKKRKGRKKAIEETEEARRVHESLDESDESDDENLESDDEVTASSFQPTSQPESKQTPADSAKTLVEGLEETRTGFIDKLAEIFTGDELDDDTVEQIEEVLFTADIGPHVAQDIIEKVEDQLDQYEKQDPNQIWKFIRQYTTALLKEHEEPIDVETDKPFVMLVVGVNGVGKTTTIGKIASKLKRDGKSVMMVAGDTFRAGAVDQLKIWAERTQLPVHSGEQGADPSSVLYDGIERGIQEDVDVILCDTSGRLHTDKNLMKELEKMERVAGKAKDGAPHETMLVLDANTGQNAIRQAERFDETLDLSGVTLTKLDGTAKGGVILGVCDALDVPIRYIGIGESVGDLRKFNSEEFVEALFM